MTTNLGYNTIFSGRRRYDMTKTGTQVFFTHATNEGLPNTFFLFNQTNGIDSTTQIS